MAKTRKDHKGRALRKGETYRKNDGLYTYKYTDPFGKKKYIYSKDLARLREREERLKKDQLDGLDIYAMGRATVDFVYDRYIKSKTELRQTTRAVYDYTYDHFVRGAFGKNKIAAVKYSDVLFFYQDLLEGKEVSISTVESVHCLLHPTFQMAVRDDIIRKNPTEGVLADVKKKWSGSAGVRRALTVAQQNRLVMILDYPENRKWKPIIIFLLGTGCRIGEVIGIRWEDIDFQERVIDINHSVSYLAKRKGIAGHTGYVVNYPKTEAGRRSIPLLDVVYDSLMEQKEFNAAMHYPSDYEVGGLKDFVFFNRYGKLHNQGTVNRGIKRLVNDYNLAEELQAKKDKREAEMLPAFSCHHLRHTFCTRLCEVETNLKLIQSIMGHADIETTMNIYAEVMEETKKESFKKLSESYDIFRTASC